VSCDGRRYPGEEAPEGVGAVPGQFHLVGELTGRCLDPVAPLGDDLAQRRWHDGALVLAGRDEQCGAQGSQFSGERLAVEALVREQVSPG
jgi:hypothetical protein